MFISTSYPVPQVVPHETINVSHDYISVPDMCLKTFISNSQKSNEQNYGNVFFLEEDIDIPNKSTVKYNIKFLFYAIILIFFLPRIIRKITKR